jgi:hypothetical protein
VSLFAAPRAEENAVFGPCSNRPLRRVYFRAGCLRFVGFTPALSPSHSSHGSCSAVVRMWILDAVRQHMTQKLAGPSAVIYNMA